MRKPEAVDYAINVAEANELKGAVLLPVDFRIEVLRRFNVQNGTPALIELFAHFIGLANSVVANNREMIELLMITDGGAHPYEAEKINLPTIFGALRGVELANGVNVRKACHGCAYRLGTCANQSPATTCDADYAQVESSLNFLCHEHLDANGNPTKLCAGHAQRTRGRERERKSARAKAASIPVREIAEAE